MNPKLQNARYEPRIPKQRFTFRINDGETGWGIWDKQQDAWCLYPELGVTPADICNLLPQVIELKKNPIGDKTT